MGWIPAQGTKIPSASLVQPKKKRAANHTRYSAFFFLGKISWKWFHLSIQTVSIPFNSCIIFPHIMWYNQKSILGLCPWILGFLGIPWNFLGDRGIFYSNEVALCGLLDSFRMRACHQKDHAWPEAWKFQPHSAPNLREEKGAIMPTKWSLYKNPWTVRYSEFLCWCPHPLAEKVVPQMPGDRKKLWHLGPFQTLI